MYKDLRGFPTETWCTLKPKCPPLHKNIWMYECRLAASEEEKKKGPSCLNRESAQMSDSALLGVVRAHVITPKVNTYVFA